MDLLGNNTEENNDNNDKDDINNELDFENIVNTLQKLRKINCIEM